MRPFRFSLLIAAAALAAGVFAQSPPADKPSPTGTPADVVREADRILTKARQLDLLNQILPVLMTKEQLRAILPAVERARAAVRKAESDELVTLRILEKHLDGLLKEAYDKGRVPTNDEIAEILKRYREMNLKRLEVAATNAAAIEEVLRKELNAGQLKAAQNALVPARIDPSLAEAELTDEQRLRFWIRNVLLDPLAYELLVRLSR